MESTNTITAVTDPKIHQLLTRIESLHQTATKNVRVYRLTSQGAVEECLCAPNHPSAHKTCKFAATIITVDNMSTPLSPGSNRDVLDLLDECGLLADTENTAKASNRSGSNNINDTDTDSDTEPESGANEFRRLHVQNHFFPLEPALEIPNKLVARWYGMNEQEGKPVDIEERLSKGFKHNIESLDETDRQPEELNLDYTRYDTIGKPFRPYDMFEDGDVKHKKSLKLKRNVEAKKKTMVVEECGISVHMMEDEYGLKVTLLFDPPRQYLLESKTYHITTNTYTIDKVCMIPAFKSPVPIQDRFIRLLRRSWPQGEGHGNAIRIIRCCIASLIYEDERKWLQVLSSWIGDMELKVGNMKDCTSEIQQWIRILSTSRLRLTNQQRFLGYFLAQLKGQDTGPGKLTGDEEGMIGSEYEDCETAVVVGKMKSLLEEGHRTAVRVESTFQVVMSVMAILESERAIDEAYIIGNLTNLAFFFIPLTFMVGFAGMDLIVFPDKINLSKTDLFAVVLGCSLITYSVLYRIPIRKFLLHIPGLLKQNNLRALSSKINILLRAALPRVDILGSRARWIPLIVFVIVVPAGLLGFGIVKVQKSNSLPAGAKGVIMTVIIAALLVLVLMVGMMVRLVPRVGDARRRAVMSGLALPS